MLEVSHEAARKQIVDLQRRGWIGTDCGPEEPERTAPTPGRPPVRYCLTAAGDQFFPKQYPELMVELLDLIAGERGGAGLTAVLARITDERVTQLEPHVTPLSLKRKMDRLRAIYSDEDPFAEVQRRGADYVLVERNCPYLNVALERPEICSTTVSALRRLTDSLLDIGSTRLTAEASVSWCSKTQAVSATPSATKWSAAGVTIERVDVRRVAVAIP